MLLNLAGADAPTQRTIREYIETHPGVHFNRIVRELDFASGQVQYHVQRLLSNEQIVKTQLYGRTHYYPPEYDDWERAALALFRRETAREILLYLLEHEPATPKEIVESLDIARSTFEWHLNHLVTQGIVKKRSDRHGVTLTLVHPDRTVRLLTKVTPSVSDQLADRFLRFVDQLFDGGDAA